MKFTGKWMGLEYISPDTKEHTWYVLTDKWILTQKFRIPKIKLTNYMELKKKENQFADTLVLLRRGSKISLGGDTETKCGVETEGKAI